MTDLHVVCIGGKRNVDRMNNVAKPQRARTAKWTIDDAFFAYDKQIEVLRCLIMDDPSLEYKKLFFKEIKNKLDGYARQDVEKKMHESSLFITLDATIELLLVGKLRCTYCRECCELIYKDVMAPKQWTLDRLNNDYGHNHNNVVLSCLACNLQRRTMDAERFKFGKQLRIIKQPE